jgi:hypothetical protein
MRREQLTEQRVLLIDEHFDEIVACHDRAMRNGITDSVVFLLDVWDSTARKISKIFEKYSGQTETAFERARRDGRVLCRCVALERTETIRRWGKFIPNLEAVAPEPLEADDIVVVAVSAGGFFAGRFLDRRGNATSKAN